jgi:hypothetical protein
VLLLVFQKKGHSAVEQIPATVVRCQDFPGQALQDAVDDRVGENPFYSVYKTEQGAFSAAEWILLPSAEASVKRKLNKLRLLSDFMIVRQGLVTGADEVFIRNKDAIPPEEQAVYAPLLHDREMEPYQVPRSVESVVFYPFVDGHKLDAATLEREFPRTWTYLSEHRPRLEKRRYLERYRKQWWEPAWPRSPQELFRSKLVSPHLVILPRFSWDAEGTYAISHSPFFISRELGSEADLLRFFLGVLNSSVAFWHLSTHSHVYRGGYLMLELKTLKAVPVPDPGEVDQSVLREFIERVQNRINRHSDGGTSDRDLDELASSLYGLSKSELQTLGASTY